MNIKTKANRVGNTSLAALGERIISTVVKSGIGEATSSKQYDVRRTEFLESVGVRVLCFENFEVFQYSTRTLDEIRKNLK